MCIRDSYNNQKNLILKDSIKRAEEYAKKQQIYKYFTPASNSLTKDNLVSSSFENYLILGLFGIGSISMIYWYNFKNR